MCPRINPGAIDHTSGNLHPLNKKPAGTPVIKTGVQAPTQAAREAVTLSTGVSSEVALQGVQTLSPASATGTSKPPLGQRPFLQAYADPTDTEPAPAQLPEAQAFELPQAFVKDVQAIAQKTGYVGLSGNAIKRAYLEGDSLFVNVSC
jgi:hypothetical protein